LIDLQCPICGKTIRGVNVTSAKLNLVAHQNGSKCRAVGTIIEANMESRKRELANLSASVSEKEARFARLDSALSEIMLRLDTKSEQLSAVEQKYSALTSAIEDNDKVLNAQREEIQANAFTLKEQKEAMEKNAEVLSVQGPQVDTSVEKLTTLHSELSTMTEAVEALEAEKSTLKEAVVSLTDDIKKTVELRPELEKAARDEIFDQLVKEETQRFNDDRMERLKNQNDYQTGVINLDEYIRREQARVAKKTKRSVNCHM